MPHVILQKVNPSNNAQATHVSVAASEQSQKTLMRITVSNPLRPRHYQSCYYTRAPPAMKEAGVTVFESNLLSFIHRQILLRASTDPAKPQDSLELIQKTLLFLDQTPASLSCQRPHLVMNLHLTIRGHFGHQKGEPTKVGRRLRGMPFVVEDKEVEEDWLFNDRFGVDVSLSQIELV